MFLYSQPDFNEIASYMEYMISDEFDHIRLIKGGIAFLKRLMDQNLYLKLILDLSGYFQFSLDFGRFRN